VDRQSESQDIRAAGPRYPGRRALGPRDEHALGFSCNPILPSRDPDLLELACHLLRGQEADGLGRKPIDLGDGRLFQRGLGLTGEAAGRSG
jgi:hypothetical protein